MLSTNSLPPNTTISSAIIRVRSVLMARTFYLGLMGLHTLPGSDEENHLLLGAGPDGPALLEIKAAPAARTRPLRTTGLFHMAFLFPDRYALACTLKRLLQHGWPLQGAADHGVSEAVYLEDPFGNGIELYADRPKEAWPMENGKLSMVSDPLNLRDLLDTIGDCSHLEIDPGTRLGHIHLSVSDLERTRWFYSQLVGLQIMQDNYPGALFFSAGGYHHHIAGNVWSTQNAPPPPPEAAGLISYTLNIPEAESHALLMKRLVAGGVEVDQNPNEFSALDPSGIRIVFTNKQG